MERLQIKLLIDGGAKRVVFAETDKAFVDLLFRILSLPVATFFGLLSKDAKVGSLTNLHVSFDNLNGYRLPTTQDPFLNPKADRFPRARGVENPYYCHIHLATPSPDCVICRAQIWFKNRGLHTINMPAAGGGSGSGKGMVTYMVMDDLTVTPMSFTELKKLNVNSVADLEELTVFFGKDEAIKLLSASLHSKNVLTDVFLKTSIMMTSNITSDCGTSGVEKETEGVKVKRETGVKRERTS